MTYTITLPRSVVEQALEALDESYADTRQGRALADALRAALEQPQVEQEPVAWQYRMRPDWGSKKDCWGPWQDCTKEQAAMYQRVPLLHYWAYESRPLYTRPQPPRQPLTDEQKAAVTRELNQARCLEKRVVGNIELTERIARAIEAAPRGRG